MVRRGQREGSILLSFLLFYGLMVGKYALICAMEIQKIHMVVHTFSGFALFTELTRVYRGVESLCKWLTTNKVHFDLPTNERKSKNIVSPPFRKLFTFYANRNNLRDLL